MRRLARRMFTLCSAVSLALFVAVCVLWVRSYASGMNSLKFEQSDVGASDEPETTRFYLSRNGLVGWGYAHGHWPGDTILASAGSEAWNDTYTALIVDSSVQQDWPARPWSAVGFDCGTARDERSYCTYIWMRVPYWLLAVVTGLVPAALAVRGGRQRRARWRESRGHCRRCGYDLRASPGRCPECGTMPQVMSRFPPRVDAFGGRGPPARR